MSYYVNGFEKWRPSGKQYRKTDPTPPTIVDEWDEANTNLMNAIHAVDGPQESGNFPSGVYVVRLANACSEYLQAVSRDLPEACKHGHPYTPSNVHFNSSGNRMCRTCLEGYNRNRGKR